MGGAQQARRIIDRLVGYEVSELLVEQGLGGLSAGRVQTVALRSSSSARCERERFSRSPISSVPAWSRGRRRFPGPRRRLRGRSSSSTAATPGSPAGGRRGGARVRRGRSAARRLGRAPERRTNPAPPFTTPEPSRPPRARSLLVRRTMMVAQRLYEGRQVGDQGRRPDHVHENGLGRGSRTRRSRRCGSTSARSTVRPACPPSPPLQQKKDAQDAHEAIRRRRSICRGEGAAYLQPDELKLYRLIWSRFSLADDALAERGWTTVEIEALRESRSTSRAEPSISTVVTTASGASSARRRSGSRFRR